MSKLNAINTFRDLLAFLTIIPLGKTEDFIASSARNMFLFPLVGGLLGLFAASYFWGCSVIVSFLVGAVDFLLQVPVGWLAGVLPAAMTLAFLLVLTGFQHFDGLIDLGNAIGLKKMEDRREIAHRWIVTYKGALLAFFVEFCAFAGLFLLNWNLALRALIVAEIGAKLAMLTIVWRGKPSHEGLGARFMRNAKRKINIAGYTAAFLIGYVLLGFVGLLAVLASVGCGLFMEKVANFMFGGVSGDIIGATNETARAVVLVLVAAVFVFVSGLFWGGLLL
ncbi:MAG: adenosylcobinamide-GDP ribazoletransferase [Candidatus Bathyarchaeota archaeon]|nr:adenosylcobinamide-GDP ribazoletransferase [Candidatus Bathyarchaeota archaeon]